MDYQGSVYYYDGYSNFMKGRSQFQGENLEADSGARRDWFVGYRHAMADHHCRVKRELDNVAHQFDSCSQQFESLSTKQDEGWCGEGLPPVGCECELFDCENWNPVIIKFVGDKYVVTERTDLGYEVVYCLAERPERFRPIRTGQESKREEAIKAMVNCSAVLLQTTADLIYNAIAAGEIPGVKLETSHE